MMLSFVVLSDGRHDYQSFRPKEDHSQWWSRRDALVRIANVCCFDGPGVYNGITKEVIYIFNDTKTNDTFERKQDKKNIGIVIVDGEKLHKEVHIPTENEILQTFRNSLKSCKEVLNEASFTSEHLQSVESFEIKMDKNNESVSSKLSKKEMISIMQQRAPLEFLRKFHLNGSLELVLKKINKNKLDEAYSEFIAASSQSEYNPLLLLFQGIFQRLRTSNPLASSKNNNKSNKKRKLEELNLSSSGDMVSSYQTIVLLLHEDYPDELPVFRQMIEEFPRNIHVVCILGAVRDITNEETMAIFQSCINLQIPCVGANLGRVAEFTSKIIATMVNHAKSGALFKAIHLLPDLTKNPIDSSILEKLPSIRKGHITWDGHQESQNKEKAEITLDNGKHQEQQPQSSQLRHHEFYTVIRVFLSTEEVLQHAAETIASQDKDDDYFEDRKKFHPLIQMIISTMWKSRFGSSTKTTAAAAAAEEVEEGGNISSSNVENILFVVFENCRIIILKEREIQKQIREYHLSAPNEYQILQLLKRLILQSSTTLEISSSPSISSIPYELNALITIFDYETRESKKLSRKELKNRKDKELFCVNLLHSFRIGNPVNILPPKTTVIEEDEKNSVISFQTQFLPKVYNESCQCGQITRDSDHNHAAATIWLFFGFDSIHSELFSTGLLLESIFRWKYAYRNSQDTTKRTAEDDDDSGKRQKKIKKISKRCLTIDTAPPSSSVVMAPAILVTLFQHFAYHDRLVPSLAQR